MTSGRDKSHNLKTPQRKVKKKGKINILIEKNNQCLGKGGRELKS